MLGEVKKLKSLVIITSCVLLTGAIFPGKLFAETVVEEWVARYGLGNYFDEARAIAVDASGNVYVTGHSYGSGTIYDYATIKYDSSGNELWVARYDGPGNGNDDAEAIAVDASGNVYVTGYSFVGVLDSDYATIKYDSSGNEQWVARYDGPGNQIDEAHAIAVDASGNVYVTGQSYETYDGTAYDCATIKYDSSGNEQWVARYNGPASWYDVGNAIAVDNSGNIYVTGYSYGNGPDYATIKYDSSGNELWVARYDGPGCSRDVSDSARAIAVDTLGNVYVTGNSRGSITEYDYATIKYDSSGNQLWVARYDGPANSYDLARALVLDTSGDVYVTGRSIGSSVYNDYDYATIKYDSSGNQLWVARYDGPANYYDAALAMALDASGNVYVTGNSHDSDTSGDCTTIKYDSSGNELWVARYNGPGNDEDWTSAMALDTSGNVYVTGQSYAGSGTTRDYTTVKYSQPSVLVLKLIQDVIALNLKNGIANNLDGKLNAALRAMEDINANDDIATINTLESFITSVELERSKENISELDADALIAAAEEIIAILSGA